MTFHSSILVVLITLFLLIHATHKTSQRYSGKVPLMRYSDNKLFNFASFDVGAKIIASSPEIKKPSRILNEDRDQYLLVPRTASEKSIIIELSEEILMYSLAIANYEYYSCSVKLFKVYGSTQYPCPTENSTGCWETLGVFRAENTRKVQTFLLPKPSITRFVKIEILTHHGNEYYITLSVVRVHGLTLLEDLKTSISEETDKPVQPPNTTNMNDLLTEVDKISKEESQNSFAFLDDKLMSKLMNSRYVAVNISNIQCPENHTRYNEQLSLLGNETDTKSKLIRIPLEIKADTLSMNKIIEKFEEEEFSGKENILKSLLNQIKKQDSKQKLFTQHLEQIQLKYMEAFRFIQKVLDKHSEDYQTLADAVYKIGKHYSNELENMRLDHDRDLREKINSLKEELNKTITQLQTTTLDTLGNLKREVLIFVIVFCALLITGQILISNSNRIVQRLPDTPKQYQIQSQIQTEKQTGKQSEKHSPKIKQEEEEITSELEEYLKGRGKIERQNSISLWTHITDSLVNPSKRYDTDMSSGDENDEKKKKKNKRTSKGKTKKKFKQKDHVQQFVKTL